MARVRLYLGGMDQSVNRLLSGAPMLGRISGENAASGDGLSGAERHQLVPDFRWLIHEDDDEVISRRA